MDQLNDSATTEHPLNVSTSYPVNVTNLEMNVTFLNGSKLGSDEEPDSPKLFALILQILLCCCIFSGNLLILAVVFVAKDMKKVTCYFVSNLALSDLCFGLALILRSLVATVKPSSMYPCRIVLSLAVTSGITSLMGIMLLCLQTYLAVKKMTPFHLAVSVTAARLAITASWLSAILIGLLNIKFTYAVPTTDASTKACFFGSGYTHTGYLIVITSIIFSAFLFISYSQIMTLLILHKRQRIITPSVNALSPSAAAARSRTLAQGGANLFSGSNTRRAHDRELDVPHGSDRRGVLGRQGSVNEIRLQIPHTGAEWVGANRESVNGNKVPPPLIFLAKHHRKNVGEAFQDTNGRSQRTDLQENKNGFLKCCYRRKNEHSRWETTHSTTDGDNSTGSLQAIRDYHKNKKMTRNHKRVMTIISSVLIVFVIGWTPYMVALFLYAMCETHCGIDANILSGLLNLCVLQSFANFFVYFVKDATFKFRVKQICSFGRDLGFVNRVAVVKSAEQGMFGAAVSKRKVGGGSGGGRAGSSGDRPGNPRDRKKHGASLPIELQSVSQNEQKKFMHASNSKWATGTQKC